MLLLIAHCCYIILALGLFFITNWIGKHSFSLGYRSLTFLNQDGEHFSFNLMFRVLIPIVYIIILSAIFYSVGLSILVGGVYWISIYYVVMRTLINFLLNRQSLVNWGRYFVYYGSVIGLTYLVYKNILADRKSLLPDFANIANELWIVILVFVFNLGNRINLSNEVAIKKKDDYINDRFAVLRKRYESIVDEALGNTVRLKPLVFSIMIYEDFNRPYLIRKTENFLASIVDGEYSMGIMQVKSTVPIDDKESIHLAVKKLKVKIEEMGGEDVIFYPNGSLAYECRELIVEYNSGSEYYDSIYDIHENLKNRFVSLDSEEKQ